MTRNEWKAAVTDPKKWDYKNNDILKQAGFAPTLLDNFGNAHFGIVAQANGWSLAESLSGAGVHQSFFQGGGSKVDAILGGLTNPFLLSDDAARMLTRNGFGWGDNPGDSLNIMEGYDAALSIEKYLH
jgi:hypothetical protein